MNFSDSSSESEFTANGSSSSSANCGDQDDSPPPPFNEYDTPNLTHDYLAMPLVVARQDMRIEHNKVSMLSNESMSVKKRFQEFKTNFWPKVKEGKLFYLDIHCPALGLTTTSFHVKTTEMFACVENNSCPEVSKWIEEEWKDYKTSKQMDQFANFFGKLGKGGRGAGKQSDDTSTDGSFVSSNRSDSMSDETEDEEWTECSDEDEEEEVEFTDEDEEEEHEDEESEEDGFASVSSDEESPEGKDPKVSSKLTKFNKRNFTTKDKRDAEADKRDYQEKYRDNRFSSAYGRRSRKTGKKSEEWIQGQCVGFNYDTLWTVHFQDFEPEDDDEARGNSYFQRVLKGLLGGGNDGKFKSRLAETEYFDMLDRTGVLAQNGVTESRYPKLFSQSIDPETDIRALCQKNPPLALLDFGWFDLTAYVEQVWAPSVLELHQQPSVETLTRYLTQNKVFSLPGTSKIAKNFNSYRLCLGEWIPYISGEDDFNAVLDEKKHPTLAKKSVTPLLANLMMASAQLIDEAWEFMDGTVQNAISCLGKLEDGLDSGKGMLPFSLQRELLWLSQFTERYGHDHLHVLFLMVDQLHGALDFITRSKMQGSALFPAHRLRYWVSYVLKLIVDAYPDLKKDKRFPKTYTVGDGGEQVERISHDHDLACLERERDRDCLLHEALLREASIDPYRHALKNADDYTKERWLANTRVAGGVNWISHDEKESVPFTTPLQGTIHADCDYWANFGLNWVTFELGWMNEAHPTYFIPPSNREAFGKIDYEAASGFLRTIALFTKGFLLSLMDESGGYTVQLRYLKKILNISREEIGFEAPAWFHEDVNSLKVFAFSMRCACPKPSALSREDEVLTSLEQVSLVASGIDAQGISSEKLTASETRPLESYTDGSWDAEDKIRTLMSVELKRSLNAALNTDQNHYMDLLEGTCNFLGGQDGQGAKTSNRLETRLSQMQPGEWDATTIVLRARELHRGYLSYWKDQSIGGWTMNSVRSASYLQQIYASAKGSFELFLGNNIVALWELSQVRAKRPNHHLQIVLTLLHLGQGKTARNWWKLCGSTARIQGPDVDLLDKKIPLFCSSFEAKTSKVIDIRVDPSFQRTMEELVEADDEAFRAQRALLDTERVKNETSAQLLHEKKELEKLEKELKALTSSASSLEKSLQSEKSKQKKALEKIKKGKGSELDSVQQLVDAERRAADLASRRQKDRLAALNSTENELTACLEELEAQLGDLEIGDLELLEDLDRDEGKLEEDDELHSADKDPVNESEEEAVEEPIEPAVKQEATSTTSKKTTGGRSSNKKTGKKRR